MNKIFKCAFGLLTLITINIACYSNADYLSDLNYIDSYSFTTTNKDFTVGSVLSNTSITNTNGFLCFDIISPSGNVINLYDITNGGNTVRYVGSSSGPRDFVCIYFANTNLNLRLNHSVGSSKIDYNVYYTSLPTVVSGNPGYSSLECQTEYNLIPINEVTPNYCALNFNMIDPAECPINSGTGAIIRSNLMINDIPYAQNQNINVFIPDFLAWNIAFNDFNTVIDIEGYNADEEYIESVINNEKLTPTPEDFTYFMHGLADFIPYLFIGLLILFAVKVFGKVWK